MTVYDSFIDGLNDADGNVLVDAQGTLDPTSITIGAVSAAPEPATWLLLFAGVAMIGGMLRSGRRRAAISTTA